MLRKIISCLINACFISTTLFSCVPVQGAELFLPQPGAMVGVSVAHMPVMMRGLKVHPHNPLLFDFLVDTGDSGLDSQSPELKSASEDVIKYFLASLTIKEEDLWVNLSPYEKERMLTEEMGQTSLGRDMLAQDYVLKQLTASLMYPEKELGKTFWNKIYKRAQQEFGVTGIPVDTFNKVWITADRAKVLERNNAGYVIDSHLKVMLEEDYVTKKEMSIVVSEATQSQQEEIATSPSAPRNDSIIIKELIREVIIPAIEEEVNQGQNFAPLRQMYHAMILASWYKQSLKNAFLNQVYADQEKVVGIGFDQMNSQDIWNRYQQAYQQGVFNYIKEDADAVTGEVVVRKYFSGGTDAGMAGHPDVVFNADVAQDLSPYGQMVRVTTAISTSNFSPEAIRQVSKVDFLEALPDGLEQDIRRDIRRQNQIEANKKEADKAVREKQRFMDVGTDYAQSTAFAVSDIVNQVVRQLQGIAASFSGEVQINAYELGEESPIYSSKFDFSPHETGMFEELGLEIKKAFGVWGHSASYRIEQENKEGIIIVSLKKVVDVSHRQNFDAAERNILATDQMIQEIFANAPKVPGSEIDYVRWNTVSNRVISFDENLVSRSVLDPFSADAKYFFFEMFSGVVLPNLIQMDADLQGSFEAKKEASFVLAHLDQLVEKGFGSYVGEHVVVKYEEVSRKGAELLVSVWLKEKAELREIVLSESSPLTSLDAAQGSLPQVDSVDLLGKYNDTQGGVNFKLIDRFTNNYVGTLRTRFNEEDQHTSVYWTPDGEEQPTLSFYDGDENPNEKRFFDEFSSNWKKALQFLHIELTGKIVDEAPSVAVVVPVKETLSSKKKIILRKGTIGEHTSKDAAQNLGGIDLNAKNLEMDVEKDGSAVQMNIMPELMEQFKSADFKGVVPHIIQITPINGPWDILGLSESDIQNQEVHVSQLSVAIKLEEV